MNNIANDVSNGKVTNEKKDGQKYERILLMVKWLGAIIFAVMGKNYVSIVADFAKDGIGVIGQFGDANQEQRVKTIPSGDSSIYVRNYSKPKINGFNATHFFENQEVINAYWKQILKRVVIYSECREYVFSFKNVFAHCFFFLEASCHTF